MKNLQIKNRGTVLIVAFMIMGVLILLGVYFLSFTLTESKISKSQEMATKTYYLAETGINEAIWKLKNDNTTADGDAAWASDFVDKNKNPYPDGSYWSATFLRNDLGGSYTVTIQNSECAKGLIIATSIIDLGGGKFSQRVVKTTAYKTLASPIDAPFYSGTPSGETDIKSTTLNIYSGDIFVNNNLVIKGLSNVTVGDKVLAVQHIDVHSGSNLNSVARCASNVCNTTSTCECVVYPEKFQECTPNSCPPFKANMPAIDFDSDEPNSYLSQAKNNDCSAIRTDGKTNCYFTSEEFGNLLWQDLIANRVTNLSGVIYVDGDIDLKGGVRVSVNGILVAGRYIKVGYYRKWGRGAVTMEGVSRLRITDPGTNIPSGLLAKGKIDVGSYFSIDPSKEIVDDLLIEGLIYAQEETSIIGIPAIPNIPEKSFVIRGGIVARKLDFDGNQEIINIYQDVEKIKEGIWGGPIPPPGTPPPPFSPIITIEHWEEEY